MAENVLTLEPATHVEVSFDWDGASLSLKPDDVEIKLELFPSLVGPAGPQGPAGDSGGFNFVQGSASASWTINHNLGYRPAVALMTVGGVELEGEVTHTSINQTIASFAAPIAGMARLI